MGGTGADETPRRGGAISFVVPALNEEAEIEATCAAISEAGSRLLADGAVSNYEIVIVNDGSTDRTGAICDELSRSNPRLRVVHRDHTGTLGAALRTGFSASHNEYVLYTDADRPFDLAETPRALRIMQTTGADVVAAYRFDRSGEGARRWVYSWAYNHLIRAVFSLDVRDVNFAAKLIRRPVLNAVNLRSSGSFIDAELLIRAQRCGFRIAQFGTAYHPRTQGISTLSSWRTIAKMVREMWELSSELGSRWSGPARSQHG